MDDGHDDEEDREMDTSTTAGKRLTPGPSPSADDVEHLIRDFSDKPFEIEGADVSATI